MNYFTHWDVCCKCNMLCNKSSNSIQEVIPADDPWFMAITINILGVNKTFYCLGDIYSKPDKNGIRYIEHQYCPHIDLHKQIIR